MIRCAAVVVLAALASGCSTLVSYQPVASGDVAVRYTQGVGTALAKDNQHEVFMYSTFKTSDPKAPTFTLGYANNSGKDEFLSPTNVRAWFNNVEVPIWTYGEKMAAIEADKRGAQVAMAILGAAAAYGAARAASNQTYTSNYSGRVYNNRGGSAGFYGSNTVKVYDPAAGMLAAGVVGGATGVGIVQIEQNANTLVAAANDILQDNTVGPQQMITGNIALRNCCDMYGPDGAIIKFEVKAGDTTKVFLFKRIKLGR